MATVRTGVTWANTLRGTITTEHDQKTKLVIFGMIVRVWHCPQIQMTASCLTADDNDDEEEEEALNQDLLFTYNIYLSGRPWLSLLLYDDFLLTKKRKKKQQRPEEI